MEETKTIDLDNPVDAKTFLRGVRIQGKEITVVLLEDGRELEIEKMTDEQLVRYAKDVYFDYCGGVEGQSGHIDLQTEGMNQ